MENGDGDALKYDKLIIKVILSSILFPAFEPQQSYNIWAYLNHVPNKLCHKFSTQPQHVILTFVMKYNTVSSCLLKYSKC